MSRDPMGFVDSYDPWQYVAGDPLNFVDPFGWASRGPGSAAGATAADVWGWGDTSRNPRIAGGVPAPTDPPDETDLPGGGEGGTPEVVDPLKGLGAYDKILRIQDAKTKYQARLENDLKLQINKADENWKSNKLNDAGIDKLRDALCEVVPEADVCKSGGAPNGGLDLQAAIDKVKANCGDCIDLSKDLQAELGQGDVVSLIPPPGSRDPLPTVDGLPDDWGQHVAVQLPAPDGRVADPLLDKIYPSIEAWKDAVVGDAEVTTMRNGVVE